MTTINVNGEIFTEHGRWIDHGSSFGCPYCGAGTNEARPLAENPAPSLITVTLDGEHEAMLHSFKCQTKFVILNDKDMWCAARSAACKVTTPEADDTI